MTGGLGRAIGLTGSVELSLIVTDLILILSSVLNDFISEGDSSSAGGDFRLSGETSGASFGLLGVCSWLLIEMIVVPFGFSETAETEVR